jgi:hypothetical protein
MTHKWLLRAGNSRARLTILVCTRQAGSLALEEIRFVTGAHGSTSRSRLTLETAQCADVFFLLLVKKTE